MDAGRSGGGQPLGVRRRLRWRGGAVAATVDEAAARDRPALRGGVQRWPWTMMRRWPVEMEIGIEVTFCLWLELANCSSMRGDPRSCSVKI
jgi:hypothetical protein